MIKRRFYKRGHGGDSSDSSSDSDSDSDSDSIHEVEEELEDEEELEEYSDEEAVERAKSEKKNKKNKRNKHSPAPGSGYESEDSSVNEVKVDSSGLLISEEDSTERGGQNRFIKKDNTKETNQGASKAEDRTLNSNDLIQDDSADYILKCKSVFKCRLCPRIVCLSEDTVTAHLNSKRHARSKKLLCEGRLKLMLNSDGEIEEDQETHEERHIRTVALAQKPVAP